MISIDPLHESGGDGIDHALGDVRARQRIAKVVLALASLNLACRNLIPTFPQRSPPLLLTTAACGGLRSAPDCRPRRAYLHLSYSYAVPFGPAILVTQDPWTDIGRIEISQCSEPLSDPRHSLRRLDYQGLVYGWSSFLPFSATSACTVVVLTVIFFSSCTTPAGTRNPSPAR
jgi:hypothetical protein